MYTDINPANTRHRPNVGPVFVRRLRRLAQHWTNIDSMSRVCWEYIQMNNTAVQFCVKAKGSICLLLRVSRYCLLPLQPFTHTERSCRMHYDRWTWWRVVSWRVPGMTWVRSCRREIGTGRAYTQTLWVTPWTRCASFWTLVNPRTTVTPVTADS